MAKIDVTQIEGYESMSAEEKLKALEDFEYEDHSAELQRHKNLLSKANGEAAEWKRKHNELLSDDEKKKAAQEEKEREFNSMKDEIASLKKEKLVSEHKAKFLAAGYDEELATETAQAFADGDTAKFFENQQKFLKTHDKNFEAELLKKTPRNGEGGDGNETMTLKKLREMSAEQRFEFSQKHPEEYKNLYGGN